MRGEKPARSLAFTLFRWRTANPPDTQTFALESRQNAPDSLCAYRRQSANPAPGDALLDAECRSAVSPKWQLTVDEENTLVVSEPKTSEAIARLDHPSPVLASAASDDGEQVATATATDIRVFSLSPKELVAQVCARQPRPPTPEGWKYLGQASQDACARARTPDGAAPP